MKILLRAAIAIFSLGIGSAYAGDGDGNSATTLFTSIPSKQASPAPRVAAFVKGDSTLDPRKADEVDASQRMSLRG